MRHKYNKLMDLNTWVQKRSLVVRNLITSLIKNWQLVTTPKRAKVLKSEMDKLISKLLRKFDLYSDENDVKREIIRSIKQVVFTKEEWKKLAEELIVKYKEEWRKTWFVKDYKLWFRKWDSVEKILVKLV